MEATCDPRATVGHMDEIDAPRGAFLDSVMNAYTKWVKLGRPSGAWLTKLSLRAHEATHPYAITNTGPIVSARATVAEVAELLGWNETATQLLIDLTHHRFEMDRLTLEDAIQYEAEH